MNPAIEMTACHCGQPAAYQSVRGNFCAKHWSTDAPIERFPRELEMLRDFYETWVSYHTIPKDRQDSQETVGEYLLHVAQCIAARGEVVEH